MQFLRVCLFLAFCLVALTQGKYSISVEPSARLEVAGREIKEGDVVPVGTEFSFKVSLSEDGEKLTKGKFVLLFQVLDSSNSVVHKQTLNGAQNTGAIEFKYELKNGNIPAGKLKFDFSVQGTDASTSVVYVFNVPMIATKIVVSSRTLKLGDSVKFSMEPASFPDLRSVQIYDASFRANRRFFLDLSSLAGHLVHSVAGTADNSGSYVFDFKIPNSLAVIGTNVISFRYVGADQASVPLSNYDSVLSELYDDPKSQNVTVEAELSIGGLKEAPKDTDFYYGNQIRYRFNIKDALSSKNVVATGYSAVLLSLAHTEGGSTFTNVQVPAKQEGEEFLISWEINPNIITGKSVLELVAQDTDGNKIPLLLNNKPASFEVNIGGHIEHTSKTHSAVSSFFQRTSLLVEFSLYCQGKLLNGAKLTASFQHGGKEVATVPATQDGNGQYSVTLLADTASVPQGTYDVLVFRDIDRQRAVEAAEAKRRKLEKDRRLKGEDASVDVATEDVTPFFTVKLEHQPSGDKLPVKPELIATVIFAAFFSYLFFKSS